RDTGAIIRTDIYPISASRIHARTKLVLFVTQHWLHLIPTRTEQPGIVDWFASMTAHETLLRQASEVSIMTLGDPLPVCPRLLPVNSDNDIMPLHLEQFRHRIAEVVIVLYD